MKKFFVSIIALFASSCSTTLDSPPDRFLWDQVKYADCDSESALPTLDNFTGGLLLGWGVVGFFLANPLSLLDIAAGGALIASGTSGERKIRECGHLKTHIAERLDRESEEKEILSDNSNNNEYFQTIERPIKTKQYDEEEKLKKQLRILELKKKIKEMEKEVQ